MAGKIFINYRRDDSIGTAGRLHDRLADVFGRDKLFMDVDQIPAGADFVAYLNDQVGACDVFLAIVGPNWLDAKDESGGRRLGKPNDFVTVEIGAALARNICVIPVLVDGARMPTEDKLPDPIKSLARRNAVDVRNAHFGRDAEALIGKMRKELKLRPWRRRAAVAGAAALVLLMLGLVRLHRNSEEADAQARYFALLNQGNKESTAGDYDRAIATLSEAIRLDPKSTLAFDSRGIAYGGKSDYDRAIADHNEALRLDPNNVFALYNRGFVYAKKGDYDRAIADHNEAIRLDPKSADAFYSRGSVYAKKGDYDRAIADFNEAIRRDPKKAHAFNNRGFAYARKGDYDRAFADYNEALRLDPKSALAFCNRGNAKLKINDASGNADIAKARELDASACR